MIFTMCTGPSLAIKFYRLVPRALLSKVGERLYIYMYLFVLLAPFYQHYKSSVIFAQIIQQVKAGKRKVTINKGKKIKYLNIYHYFF